MRNARSAHIAFPAMRRDSNHTRDTHGSHSARTTRQRRQTRAPRFLGALLAIGAAVFIFAGLAFAQAQVGGVAAQASAGKHILTAPQPVHQLHKRAIHNATLATSCASANLPQPGIVTIAPPSTAQYQLDSVAVGVWDGKAYQLFGGSLRSDPSQGVILVMPIVADPCHAQTQGAAPQVAVILTPTHAGRVTFTSVEGKVVAFTTASGKAGRLDFTTHRFVA